MALLLYTIAAIVAIALLLLLLLHYRRQESYQSGPGVVPEEYD